MLFIESLGLRECSPTLEFRFCVSINKNSDFCFGRGIVYFKIIFFNFFKFKFIYFNWRLITLQYCIGLPYINMNLPQVYILKPLPPSSPYHPSGSSQCTSPKHPVSCVEPGLAIRFLYDIIHVSKSFSQIIPPSLSPTQSKRRFYTSVSPLLSCIQGYHYHLSRFHIYALVYCIGVFFFLAYFTLYNRLQFHPPH